MKKINIDKADIEDLTAQIRDIILQNGDEGISDTVSIDIKDFIKLDDNLAKARLMFSPLAYAKMLGYIRECDLEIAWHGVVERISNDDIPVGFYVKDVICYPQKITGATVETDDEPYNQWINSLDTDTYNNMRIQCHSHVNMGVTPSSTDWNYYKQQLRDTADDDFYIFLIMNKRHELWYNIYDKLNNIHYEKGDIEFSVVDENFNDLISNCKSDITKYCQKPTYTEVTTAAKTSNYTPSNYWYDQTYGNKSTTSLWEDEDDYDAEQYLAYHDEYRKLYIEGTKQPFISYREFRNQKLKENKNESKQK